RRAPTHQGRHTGRSQLIEIGITQLQDQALMLSGRGSTPDPLTGVDDSYRLDSLGPAVPILVGAERGRTGPRPITRIRSGGACLIGLHERAVDASREIGAIPLLALPWDRTPRRPGGRTRTGTRSPRTSCIAPTGNMRCGGGSAARSADRSP